MSEQNTPKTVPHSQGSAEALAEAARGHLRAQRFDEAAAAYRDAVAAAPEDAQVRHGLGVAELRRRGWDAARTALRQALALRPDYHEALSNLGIAHHGSAGKEAAVACFRRALRAKPDFADALTNLNTVLRELDREGDAADVYEQLLRADPKHREARRHIAQLRLKAGKPAEAMQTLREHLALHGDDWQALQELGRIQFDERQYEEALKTFQKALAIAHDQVQLLNDLGRVLDRLQRHKESLQYLRHAATVAPDNPQVLNNLANALMSLGRFTEAESVFTCAFDRSPATPELLNNYANVVREQGRFEEGAALYRKALELKPDYPSAVWNLSLIDLLLGDYENGWRRYESRFEMPDTKLLYPDQGAPRWQGEDLRGRSIFIVAEQGHGDTIQFMRYIPLVAARGGRVVVQVHDTLLRLFKGYGHMAMLIGKGQRPVNVDCHCYMLSLPHILGTTVDTVPSGVPYLTAEPELVQRWWGRLKGHRGKLMAGLVWAGSPKHRGDRSRSIPLALLSRLLETDGVSFVSLQVGERMADLADFPSNRIRDLTPYLHDFADTAAAITNLDLVITVDTSVAHLAGALGKPVWLMLPRVPDWRWMLDRTDTPWYPTMRLFRQSTVNEWEDVVDGVIAELKRLCAGQVRRIDAAP